MDMRTIDRPRASTPHPTAGHYRASPSQDQRQIRSLDCAHCAFSALLSHHRKAGDRSGQGRYNRARAAMVKHLYAEHRDLLNDRTPKGV